MNLRELMDVLTYEEKLELARKADTGYYYLFHMAAGARLPSPRLARKLVEADNRLTLAELRPDIWGDQVAA